jgi:hypothetical protein
VQAAPLVLVDRFGVGDLVIGQRRPPLRRNGEIVDRQGCGGSEQRVEMFRDQMPTPRGGGPVQRFEVSGGDLTGGQGVSEVGMIGDDPGALDEPAGLGA